MRHSIRTEAAYVHWIKAFIHFHHVRTTLGVFSLLSLHPARVYTMFVKC